MEDYNKHVASSTGTVDPLSTSDSVVSAVNRLVDDREEKQWKVSLMGNDVNIRKQTEKLVKFLLWSKDIVQEAVSTQPYAALALSAASLLLPVGGRDGTC